MIKIKINKIYKDYDNFNLDISNIDINKGEIIGLVGVNGSGKSTFMKALSEEGFADFYSVEADFKEKLYIPTEVEIYEYLTVEEFIKLLVKYNDTDKNVAYLIELLDLKSKEKDLISELSTGMKKKLSLAPIFVRNYDLLMLDEPFNAIDLLYIIELKKYIKELAKNRAVIISSHVLDSLNNLCDRIIVLRDGKLEKEIRGGLEIVELEKIISE